MKECKEKICDRCQRPYKPNSGAQKICNDCRLEIMKIKAGQNGGNGNGNGKTESVMAEDAMAFLKSQPKHSKHLLTLLCTGNRELNRAVESYVANAFVDKTALDIVQKCLMRVQNLT